MTNLAMFKQDASIKEQADTLGGFAILDSDLYDATIELAYIEMSKGGAYGVVFKFKTDDGASLDHTFWISSGREKGQLNYYIDKSGDKQYLPGFNAMNAVSLFTTDKEMAQLAPEEKTIMVYNYELKKDAPTAKPVLTELMGKKVKLGVLKQLEDKNKKNDMTGKYEPTGETRNTNEIDRVFHFPTGLTVIEAKSGKTTGEFCLKWQERNKGQVRDKTAAAKGATATPAASAPTGTSGGSLFGNAA